MGSNHDLEQLLDRIGDSLAEYKGDLKQQFARSVELEEWSLSDNLSECAAWLDAGITACSQMKTRIGRPSATPEMPIAGAPSSAAEVVLPTSDQQDVNSHPFWGLFFERGIHFHPELDNKKPTGGLRKIGPTIPGLPGIQIDVAYSTRGVSCRLLSMKPEKLKPLLKLKPQFAEAVDGEIEWNDGNKNRSHLSVTVRPASNLEQQGWPIEEKVARLLKLYGQIKQFVIENLK